MIKMEEQEEPQETIEPTPAESVNEQLPLSHRPINISLSDSYTNSLKIGDLIITSPILPIKEMVKVSKDLLKDKQVRSYLESVKENKIKSGGKYFG